MTTSHLNIHDKSSDLLFTPGKYHVLIIGGWLIEENRFKVRITEMQNKKRITVKKVKWSVQSIEFGRRAKRCYEFDVITGGKYQVNCENPDTLKVKKSNIILFNFLYKYVDNSSLEILITKG